MPVLDSRLDAIVRTPVVRMRRVVTVAVDLVLKELAGNLYSS